MSRTFTVTKTAEGDAERYHVVMSADDHSLLAAETFGSVGDLLGWLDAKAGVGDDRVIWTQELLDNEALAAQIAGALRVRLAPPERRHRRRRPS
jgi:hypothetical protein